jgi:hypothetical protein
MSHRFLMAIIDYGGTVPPYMTLASEFVRHELLTDCSQAQHSQIVAGSVLFGPIRHRCDLADRRSE